MLVHKNMSQYGCAIADIEKMLDAKPSIIYGETYDEDLNMIPCYSSITKPGIIISKVIFRIFVNI